MHWDLQNPDEVLLVGIVWMHGDCVCSFPQLKSFLLISGGLACCCSVLDYESCDDRQV